MGMRCLIMGFCTLLSSEIFGQEFKLAKKAGSIEIRELNKVKIEGYVGNEIVFLSRDYDSDHDERAEGLRAIGNFGLEDNTGIGLSVIDNNGVVEVKQLKKWMVLMYLLKYLRVCAFDIVIPLPMAAG